MLDMNADSTSSSGGNITSALDAICGCLGCDGLLPDADGLLRVYLDQRILLSIQPHPNGEQLALVADLPIRPDRGTEELYRTALAHNLGAASFGAPVLSKGEGSRLALAGAIPLQSDEPGFVQSGVMLFLENVGLAERALAEEAPPEEALPGKPKIVIDSPELAAAWRELETRLADFFELEELQFREDGSCLLTLPDQNLLLVQRRLNRKVIALHTEVASLQNREVVPILEAALEFNFQNATEGGPVLALDAANEVLLLVQVIPLGFHSHLWLEEMLEGYFATVDQIRGARFETEDLDRFFADFEEPDSEEETHTGQIRV